MGSSAEGDAGLQKMGKPTTLGRLAVGRTGNMVPAIGLSRNEISVAQGCLGRSMVPFQEQSDCRSAALGYSQLSQGG